MAALEQNTQAYPWELRRYQQRLGLPLRTHHGIWRQRRGLYLCLKDGNGRQGYGEIAPMPWFGSETLAAALAACWQLPNPIKAKDIAQIPDHLPACQFGWLSAWRDLQDPWPLPTLGEGALCALLPPAEAALGAWPALWQAGHRTFKVKIALGDFESEARCLAILLESLPKGAKLRLDANGGLDLTTAERWLAWAANRPIEFLEQPLGIGNLAQTQQLSQTYPTPIALDEAVANARRLHHCGEQGWSGLVVIKPAIWGSPRRLGQLCQTYGFQVVGSSALETSIGRRAAIALSQSLGRTPPYALGFGVDRWLPFVSTDPADLWQQAQPLP